MGKQHYQSGRAWIELDIGNLKHNVRALKELLPEGCEMMPVLKANAYGHGGTQVAKELNKMGIAAFCVASIAEAVQLRQHGVSGEILVLGFTHPYDFSLLTRYDLTQTALNYEYAEWLDSYHGNLKVHVAVDIGMHRTGVPAENLGEILEILRMKHIRVSGIFTHLGTDDSLNETDVAFTKMQAASFAGLTKWLREDGFDFKSHIISSYGLLNYPELGGDYARIGIALYGVLSNRCDIAYCRAKLRPVLSVKARIMTVRRIHSGEHVGYGFAYTADGERMIATLSIGYADGLPRNLSCGRGRVLINGHSAPVAGFICMDQMMVDVTGIEDVKSGDVAVIIGRSGNMEITAYELAEKADTITNEVLSRLGNRLERQAIRCAVSAERRAYLSSVPDSIHFGKSFRNDCHNWRTGTC